MGKHHKFLIIGGVLAAIAAVVYLVKRKKDKDDAAKVAGTTTGKTLNVDGPGPKKPVHHGRGWGAPLGRSASDTIRYVKHVSGQK